MSASVKVGIDDAQFDAKDSLAILDAVLRVLRDTGKTWQDRVMYQNISEAREKLARTCQILEQLNPNGRSSSKAQVNDQPMSRK